MRTVFADTFYFIAQLNTNDDAHAAATAFTSAFNGQLLNSDWVLVELADAFSGAPNRERFVSFYRRLPGLSDLRIIPATRALLDDGFQLYASRPDKEWSLTDCISFVLMQNEGLREALTGDRHFEQAGFVALLK